MTSVEIMTKRQTEIMINEKIKNKLEAIHRELDDQRVRLNDIENIMRGKI